jgi:hypothetical protein
MASTRPMQIMCTASIPRIAARAVGAGTLHGATVVCQIGGLIRSSCWLSVALSSDNADAAFPLQFQDRRSITSPAVPKRTRAWGRLTGFSNAFFGCFPVSRSDR